MTFHQQQQVSSTTSNGTVDKEKIELGLDYILSHFEESIFPRKISTFKSNNKQFLVRSRKEIIDSFIDSKLMDCRINAYPCLTEYKGIQRYKPDFLFIDLDKNNFKTIRSFELALYNTLKNIKNKLNGFPTVLFTGGGYHIYQPVYCPTALENVTEFQKFDKKPSQEFLRFAKDCLSNGKADKNNNPSFKSCLLRIPGSINSKYNKQVRIIHKWNGIRSLITKDLLIVFRRYLIQQSIDQYYKNRQKIIMPNRIITTNQNYNSSFYEWIEQLLQTPIEDYRKLVLWKILCPYLVNIRKLSQNDSLSILKEWLNKCNSLQKLDFNPNQKIKDNLKYVGNFYPLGIKKLKTDEEYNKLYLILNEKIELNASKNHEVRN